MVSLAVPDKAKATARKIWTAHSAVFIVFSNLIVPTHKTNEGRPL
jgi:hypothetical protein